MVISEQWVFHEKSFVQNKRINLKNKFQIDNIKFVLFYNLLSNYRIKNICISRRHCLCM